MSVVGRNFVAAANMPPVSVDVTTVIRGVFILPKPKYKTKVYVIVIRIRLVPIWRELGGKSIKEYYTERVIDFCWCSWWFVIITYRRSEFIQPCITADLHNPLFVCILMYLTKTWLISALAGGVCWSPAEGQGSLSYRWFSHNTPTLHVWLQQT